MLKEILQNFIDSGWDKDVLRSNIEGRKWLAQELRFHRKQKRHSYQGRAMPLVWTAIAVDAIFLVKII